MYLICIQVLYISCAAAAEHLDIEQDTPVVFEELLPAVMQTYLLAITLKLLNTKVESIFQQYSNPELRLYQVLIAVFQQSKTPITWRTFIDALNSKAVGHYALARKLEEKYYPQSTGTAHQLC